MIPAAPSLIVLRKAFPRRELVINDSFPSLIMYGNTSSRSIAMAVDYSLYLVTDSTRSILGDRDLISVVRAALEGGGKILLCIFILINFADL